VQQIQTIIRTEEKGREQIPNNFACKILQILSGFREPTQMPTNGRELVVVLPKFRAVRYHTTLCVR
jgi:hypothetical protein